MFYTFAEYIYIKRLCLHSDKYSFCYYNSSQTLNCRPLRVSSNTISLKSSLEIELSETRYLVSLIAQRNAYRLEHIRGKTFCM